MGSENQNGFSVIFAGLGGHGALTFGQFLAEASATRYAHVSFFPYYATVMRGGESESTVIASDQEIASPVRWQLESVIVTSPTAFRLMEERVCPGGVILVDSSIVNEKVKREDAKAFYIPAARIAVEKIGQPLASNLILMGSFLKATQVLPLELVEATMEKKLKGTRRADLLPINIKALREGVALIAANK